MMNTPHNPNRTTMRWIVFETLCGLEELSHRQIEEETDFDGEVCAMTGQTIGGYLSAEGDYDVPRFRSVWRADNGDLFSEDAACIIKDAFELGQREGKAQASLDRPVMLDPDQYGKVFGEETPTGIELAAYRVGLYEGWTRG